jgi:hypothetical protein
VIQCRTSSQHPQYRCTHYTLLSTDRCFQCVCSSVTPWSVIPFSTNSSPLVHPPVHFPPEPHQSRHPPQRLSPAMRTVAGWPNWTHSNAEWRDQRSLVCSLYGRDDSLKFVASLFKTRSGQFISWSTELNDEGVGLQQVCTSQRASQRSCGGLKRNHGRGLSAAVVFAARRIAAQPFSSEKMPCRSRWSRGYHACYWTQISRVQNLPRRWIFFKSDKNPYYDFFRREVKPLASRRNIFWHIKDPCGIL